MDNTPLPDNNKKWKLKLHEIIYEADTPNGKLFDILLLILILASILLVMLESVKEIDLQYHFWLNVGEWIVTILFTIEYIARIVSVKKPWRYIFSFYGIIDLLSTLPKYLSLILVGTHALVAIRALRLLRIFRILKLARYLGASNQLTSAIKASRAKILVFIFTVVIIATIFGTIMYLVEGEENGFSSIPRSVYWAIVTLTTVGYGDIAPQTALGQLISTVIMILGYGIIAVPTGIISAEYSRSTTTDEHPKKDVADHNQDHVPLNTLSCQSCLADKHKDKAEYCYNCGHPLFIEKD